MLAALHPAVWHDGQHMRRLAILGSTGSIGTQALDIARKHPDRFEVVALVAGRNAERLAQQVDEFRPAFAVLADGEAGGGFRVGWDGVLEAAAFPAADIVLNALVGSRGLGPTLAALDAGKTVALANKESLVAGGDLVMARARPGSLIPVDSEHAAVAQCLADRSMAEVRRLILTASGGPFRGRARADLIDVTVEQALAHPTWRMGRKITVDSATLMNKGLEVLEAHHLFAVEIDRIDVVVHPSSVVHAIVEFTDGSSLMAASNPDMHLPIQAALSHPERLPGAVEPVAWDTVGALAFEPVDHEAFPAIELARAAARAGGSAPAVLNAANEEAVQAFLDGGLAFLNITTTVADVVAAHTPFPIDSLAAVAEAETWARAEAQRRIKAAA